MCPRLCDSCDSLALELRHLSVCIRSTCMLSVLLSVNPPAVCCQNCQELPYVLSSMLWRAATSVCARALHVCYGGVPLQTKDLRNCCTH